MHLEKAIERADAPHTLHWPWMANWRCDQDPTHVELISPTELRAIKNKMRDQSHG